MTCPLCHAKEMQTVYRVASVPVFQNRVYTSRAAARDAPVAELALTLCRSCQFVFNACFDDSLLVYDAQYQNEQALSALFDGYLESIVDLLGARGFRNKRVLEIGCGKGTFLQKLWQRGIDACGCDSAYEGNDPRIARAVFSAEVASAKDADLIVLRHTLEHISNPLQFLHGVAAATSGNAQIFIEVPSFEWIVRKRAFWDLFYEHCNYFTTQSLGNLFENAEQGFLFNGQYMYILAELGSLRAQAAPSRVPLDLAVGAFESVTGEYRELVRRYAQENLVIWGAGAKGSTFVSMTDPYGQHIAFVIDINPRKQGTYIARTGHRILAPGELDELASAHVLVMNENYYDEVRSALDAKRFRCHVLGQQ